jgi:Double zinc ribbon domain
VCPDHPAVRRITIYPSLLWWSSVRCTRLACQRDIVILRTAFDALAAVLFPAPCRICATTLLTASRLPICESCLASFQPIVQPMCQCCGRPFPPVVAAAAASIEAARPLCRLCREGNYAFDRARSYGLYNDALHHAILLLKYRSNPLGRLVCGALSGNCGAGRQGFPRGRGGASAAAS